jgi:ABC-2 type transport system ATP-binding protein
MSGGADAGARTGGSSSDAVLRTEHLAKTYVLGFFRKKVRAITDVSLEVQPGEIFGLLGPNGAGKTTTLKVLMGLVRATAGSASVLGRPVGDIDSQRRLGYLPESPYFYDYLTGRELLVFMARLFGYPRAEARRRAQQMLELVQITEAADRALRHYSKGMLQRVGLGQALINDPELVVLDEPLTGLDPLGRKSLRDLIAGLREQGKTVVLSSHILSDVELLADRVVVLVKGRTVSAGPLHELLDARVLSTEIVLRGHSPELLAALEQAGHQVQASANAAQVKLLGDEPVDAVLDLIREHGGTVRAVTPRKESLEELVIQQAEAAS